jgi:hypothetical protein
MNTKSKYINTVRNKNIRKLASKKKIILAENLIIDSPKLLQKKIKYNYNISDILETNTDKISKKINLVFVCIYVIIDSKNRINVPLPYLQYLLFKYQNTNKKFPNYCIFPFIKAKNKNYKTNADKLVNTLLDVKIDTDGFIESNNNLFFFYNYTTSNKPLLNIPNKKQNTQLWWTNIDEICNQKKIIYFPIHKSVWKLFFNYPNLIYIKDYNKNNIEIPIIGYYGDYYKFIPMIATLGQKIANPKKGYDKFFYVTDFKKAVRYACWTSNYSSRTFGDVLITGDNGKYDKGGVVRFAVFMHKIFCPNKWLSQDEIDKHHQSNEFDSLYVGRTLKNDGSYISITPTYIIKNFKQHVPLSIHYIDNSKLPPIWSNDLDFFIE